MENRRGEEKNYKKMDKRHAFSNQNLVDLSGRYSGLTLKSYGMKNIIVFTFLILFGTTVMAQDYLNIMTFNIRYNNPSDSLNAWPYRADKAASQVLFHEAHIVGVQEALFDQVAKEEANIRANPMARTSDLLKKVFGSK